MIKADAYVQAGKALLDYASTTKVPYVNNGSTLQGMDCQGLMEYLLRQCGVSQNWRGSNDMWRNALSWSGSIEECVKKYGAIPPGAWLFIWKEDGAPASYKDDKGNASHVGAYLGGTVAVHASSSRGQVAQSYIGKKSINGGWNRVGLCKLIDYGLGGSESQNTSQGGSVMEKYIVSPDGGYVNIRSEASTKSPYIAKAEPGNKVEVLEAGDEWSKVNYTGKVGYVMSKFLSGSISNEANNSNSSVNSGGNSNAKEKIQAAIAALNEALKLL